MTRSTSSFTCLVAVLFLSLAVPSAVAVDRRSAATVSFGQWQTGPTVGPPPASELDRFPNLSPRLRNNHQLIPNVVTIPVGGAVNFIIGGFHHPIVYGNGTQPESINVNIPTPPTTTRGPNPFPPVALIDDPTNRIYRGLDPSLQPLDLGGAFLQDRVEVVNFPNPGTYLVICGIRGHFVNDGMFGFVIVNP